MVERIPHPDYPDRDTKGRLMPGHDHRITTETHPQMTQARRDKQREANDQAMIIAIEHDQALENVSAQDAAALIVAKQTVKAISPDQPGTTSAARFVFQETGRAQDRQVVSQQTNINLLPDSVKIEIGKLLLSPVSEQSPPPDVIEGKIRLVTDLPAGNGSEEGTNSQVDTE